MILWSIENIRPRGELNLKIPSPRLAARRMRWGCRTSNPSVSSGSRPSLPEAPTGGNPFSFRLASIVFQRTWSIATGSVASSKALFSQVHSGRELTAFPGSSTVHPSRTGLQFRLPAGWSSRRTEPLPRGRAGSESSRRTAFRPSTRDPPRSRPGRAVPSPIPWARPWAGREAGESRRRRRDSEAASRQRRPGRRSCRPSETAGGCRRGWDRRRRARGGGFAGRGGQRSRSDGRGVLALAPGRPFATVETCGSRKQERDGAGMLDPERIVLHYDGALVGVRAKVAFEAHPLSIIGRGINDRVGAIVVVRVA